MDTELLTCGYSFHMEPFNVSTKSGLNTYLFRLQTEGTCEILVDGQMIQIESGHLLLYKPGDPYELKIEPAKDSPGGKIASGDYYLFCKGAWIDAWWKRSYKQTCTRIDLDARLISLWRQLILEKRRMEEENRELSGYLLQALCLYVERAATETVSLQGRPFTGTRMKRFIEAHATATFKVDDVADHVGLSVSRAVHLFKECFGKTMIQYALEVRLSSAVERMHDSSMSLEQIALSCGFGSYPYFHRAFKHRFGISPKLYRQKDSQN
ncbi:helix-turn-helix transcriptional regulator [Paenibacillus sp. CGMCC 1.16610]|uniref:AraC family transcriptional regulator n=2 Tax=Paenibacillus anseongense TaxID=2682845 RepID=A0ABW9U765_9BACL|nr:MULTISPECIES: AraC family transcriptional regulator [Paenibacillus]MBA2942111.1 helix-turn-helix transcriptional regulator [Paenibacillus sp. CGMCC 1.16610]MVQ35944.1 AraC family transcriptional regulator [Paenibacillus anseongense]